MCALRILTTRPRPRDRRARASSLNATLVTDELLRDLRAALAARFRAAQNNTLTRTAIRSAVLLVLQDYRARGWLSAFGDLRVYADAGDASLCRVEFTYSIPAGLHRIALFGTDDRLRRGSMTGICIPTSADIRIEVAGRRVAVVQSYRVEEEASCEVVGAIGSNEPVGVVAARRAIASRCSGSMPRTRPFPTACASTSCGSFRLSSQSRTRWSCSPAASGAADGAGRGRQLRAGGGRGAGRRARRI